MTMESHQPESLQLMASENVNADDPLSLSRVLSFLNEKKIKYRASYFSPSYPIEFELSSLGLGLLEGVPIEVSGRGVVLAIIPAALAIDPRDLSALFAPSQVRFLTPTEISRRFSFKQSTSTIPPLGGLFGLETFVSPLIEQRHAIGFFADSRSTLITLEAPTFHQILCNASAIPIPTRSKYRARPFSTRSKHRTIATPERKALKRCILGVSLESSDFYPAKLIAITNWIRRHYADCDVMMGDGVHRITLLLDSGENCTLVKETEALERSKWLARDWTYSNLSAFNVLESPCRFNFVFMAEIQKTQDYLTYYNQLLALFSDDREFQYSVEAFASAFLSRKPSRQEHSKINIELSCRYILEELAVIGCLAQSSPCAFVYPGSLTLMKEIAEGLHPSVSACLQQIDYVELHLKRRPFLSQSNSPNG
jgi:tRNA-dependent cyclodipeptide synthase